jgi:hypothetical protein
MAVLGDIRKGYHAEYFPAHSKGPAYFSEPAGIEGWEPAGIWVGDGCRELGLAPGSEIEHDPFLGLFTTFTDPRDPTSTLGHKPYRSWVDKYKDALKAEPGADEARRAILRIEAKVNSRPAPVPYWGYTFSPSKDITLLHASFAWNEQLADYCGDQREAEYWHQAAEDVWDCIWEGFLAAISYLQEHAAQTRTGHHSRLPSGQDTGMWEFGKLVAAAWKQHTSRAGDPQLHIHALILNKLFRELEGKWSAIDGKALIDHMAAATRVGGLVLENALAREFGVEYHYDEDSRGRLIKGVSRPVMDQYSKRARQDVEPLHKALIRKWSEGHGGQEPDPRTTDWLRVKANTLTASERKRHPGLAATPTTQGENLADYVRQWATEARTADADALADLGPSVTNRKGPGGEDGDDDGAPAPDAPPGVPALTPGQELRLMTAGLELAERDRTTFLRADLESALGELLPAYMPVLAPDQARDLIPALASRVLTGEAGDVTCLEAPDIAGPVPARFRRQDGESMFRRHGSERYATGAQLAREDRITNLAGSRLNVPRMNPDEAAQLLGAAREALEAQLQRDTGADIETITGAGLRLEQAAAVFRIVTSSRRAPILIGPAGTGKTTAVGFQARMWRQAFPGTKVIGLTTSQIGANVLREAGVRESWNIDHFFATQKPGTKKPVPGSKAAVKRAARLQDRLNLPQGSLIILDEASMTSMGQFERVLQLAAKTGSKVAIVGDPYQLGAVSSPGGMMMLARRFGYVQLAEAQRFHEKWEREASLRLREGDKSVLAEYHERGRFRFGTTEQVAEQAYRMWVTDYLAGRQSALITHTQSMADELSRRARADLVHFQRVTTADGAVHLRGKPAASAAPWLAPSSGPQRPTGPAGLVSGAQAAEGDIIMARRNDHRVSVGAGQRTLTNRDRLQVLSTVSPDRDSGNWAQLFRTNRADANARWHEGEVQVRVLLGTDDLGEQRYGQPFWLSRSYLREEAHLAYGMTVHSTEGSTFAGSSYSVIRASDNLPTLYTAATRGRTDNIVFVAVEHEVSDLAGGPQPDPELARAAMIERERAGEMLPGPVAPRINGLQVLGQILERRDPHMGAGELQQQNLSDADHLGDIGNRFNAIAAMTDTARYERVLQTHMTDAMAQNVLADDASWTLLNELKAAEAAGMNGEKVLADAVKLRDFTGAVSYAKVLHGRVRQATRDLQPLTGRTWADRVPAASAADTQTRIYLTGLATAADARRERLGEHTAGTQPLWAKRLLGEYPAEADKAADWRERAGWIAQYAEMHPDDFQNGTLGPEPSWADPQRREDWHNARQAIGGHMDGIDLVDVPDEVLAMRSALYERETAGLPAYVGEELRVARIAARDYQAKAERALAEAEAAVSPDTRTEHERNWAIWNGIATKAKQTVDILEPAHETEREARRIADPTLRTSQASRAEEQRRHPERQYEPLTSAAPRSPVLGHGAPEDQRLDEPGTAPAAEPDGAPAWDPVPEGSRLADMYAEHAEGLAALDRAASDWASTILGMQDNVQETGSQVPPKHEPKAGRAEDVDDGDWRPGWMRDLPQGDVQPAPDHSDDWDVTERGLELAAAEPEDEPGEAHQRAEPDAVPKDADEVLTKPDADDQLREALGLTPDKSAAPVSEHVEKISAMAREAQDRLDEIRSRPEPAGGPDDELDDEIEPGPSWGDAHAAERDSVLQDAWTPVAPPDALDGSQPAEDIDDGPGI